MIIKSPYPDTPIPDVALTTFVLRHAARLGEKIAIECALTGARYSYHELASAIEYAAAGFTARGITKGDVIGMVSPNTPDFAVAFFALTLIGAVPSTVNPAATAEEIGTQFADSAASAIVTTPMLLAKCREAATNAESVRALFVMRDASDAAEIRDATTLASLIDEGRRFLAANPDVRMAADIAPATDLAVLPYSSGTSGLPKGVMLTHRNIVANLQQTQGDRPMLREVDRVIAVLPFYHIYGMTVVLAGALAQGATVITMPRFELDLFLGTIERHRISYANIVPPIVLALAKHPMVADFDLSSLRIVFSGAAPLGEDIALGCARTTGARIFQGYGLTETSPVTNHHPYAHGALGLDTHGAAAAQGVSGTRYDATSVGPLLANTEARLVSTADGTDVATGTPGELLLRGPQVMIGYLGNERATSEALSPDGWFRTGDIAIVDDEGWFYIVDRVKELIKYKGMQVAPAELEAALLSHPDVADAAVIPVPDAEAGEIPKAFVVCRVGTSAEDLIAFVAERVTPYKKVRRIEFVESIPKSPSGKILRRLLVERERVAAQAHGDQAHGDQAMANVTGGHVAARSADT